MVSGWDGITPVALILNVSLNGQEARKGKMEKLHNKRIASVRPRLSALGLVCGMALALLLPAACGSGGDAEVAVTPVSVQVTEAVRIASATATVGRPRVRADLPLLLRSRDGWSLRIDKIEFLDSVEAPSERYRPENGVFVVLIGTIENATDADACLKGEDIALIGDGQRYEMDVVLLDVLKPSYSRDYPGFFRGQCLDYDTTEKTFMVFDAPESVLLSLSLKDASQDIGVLDVDEMAVVEPTEVPPETSNGPATPSASSAPVSSPAPIAKAIVLRGANLRAGPGTDFEVIGTASQGEELPVFGRSNNSAWVMVRSDEPAWIWIDLVELSMDITEVNAATALTPPPADSMVSSTASPNPSPSPLPSSTPSLSDLTTAWVYCEYAVKSSLKAPRTAKFPWANPRSVFSLGDNRFQVNSYVDAENSFGAMLRNYFTCTVIKVDEDIFLLESLEFK